MINWNRFDRIVVICHTAYARQRIPALEAEFKRVGLTRYEKHWTCPTPFTGVVRKPLNYYRDDVGGLQCTLAHYQVIKTAYELGHERLLVLEDDVRFLHDPARLEEVIGTLPYDYDVAKLEWSPTGNEADINARQDPDLRWIDGCGLQTYGAAATAYSRRGMKALIEQIERAASGETLHNIDDNDSVYGLGLKNYLAQPVAAIQSAGVGDTIYPSPRYYGDFLVDRSRSSYGDIETAGCNIAELRDKEKFDEIMHLAKVAYRGKPMTVLEIGSYRGESAEAFLKSGLVERIYCVDPWTAGWDQQDELSHHDFTAVERDFDRRAAKDRRIVKVVGTFSTFLEEHPDVQPDLIYVDGSRRYQDVREDLETAQRLQPSCGIAGRVFTYDSPVRKAVLDVLGFPYQVFNDTSWFFPTDKGVVPEGEERHWHFLGGRLGNQLYYLLQAHRMGRGNVYVGAGDDMQGSFERLCGKGLAAPYQYYPDYVQSTGQHWNQNLHYTWDDVQKFVTERILTTPLFQEIEAQHGRHDEGVAFHIRNTDFLTEEAWGQIDREAYMRAAILRQKELNGVAPDGKLSTAYLYSDDNDVTRQHFGELLQANFEEIVYMDRLSAEEDMLRLALHRNKILFNSTFSTWAAHIGDVALGNAQVVCPSVFYVVKQYIEPMATLAPPRWHQVETRLKDGRVIPPRHWPEPSDLR